MSASKILRMALCQLKVGSHKQSNHKNAVKLIEEAVRDHKADLVVLPECFNSPYGPQFFPDNAEKVPSGVTCELMGATAK